MYDYDRRLRRIFKSLDLEKAGKKDIILWIMDQEMRRGKVALNQDIKAINAYAKFIGKDIHLKLWHTRGERVPKVMNPYTIEEVRKILEMFDKSSFENHQLRTLIWVIFWTGMRLREAVNIREMDVNIESQTILVRNKMKYRTVYIPNALAIVLEEYMNALKNHIKKDEGYARKSPGHIFTFKDKGSKQRDIDKIVAKYAYKIKKKASFYGIYDFTITNLRRTLVTLLFKVGASPHDVKWQMHGHSPEDFVEPQWNIELFHSYLSLNESYNKLEEWLLNVPVRKERMQHELG